VTGGSSGIGLELARQFARHGFDLVIAARDPDVPGVAALHGLGAGVDPVAADLATDDGVRALHARLAGRPLAAAALNAGVAAGGAFADAGPDGTELEDELALIDLNVRGTVHLAKLVARDMVARGEGRILFTSSISSNMPGAFHAVYNASKSFVQSFALALREELRGTGVSVTLLMPGPTRTALFARADMLDTQVATGPQSDPADVARAGFRALMAGDERVTPGLQARAEALASRFVPDGVKAAFHRLMAQPGTGRQG
jgi:short-subunit dehydrogenase